MTQVAITDLTDNLVNGSGAFDVLMRSNKAHLEEEFDKNRIRGPEYATVYLGSLEATMRTALEYLLARQRVDLEAQLMGKQLIAADQALLKLKADTTLVEKHIDNAILEGKVLIAQECKLRAEFDLTMKTIDKVNAETALLAQKVVTEKAQTQSVGIDANSVIGKQKALYQAQTDGFARDSEQKAAKILIDTWSARRMTDEATVANGINKLSDTEVGRVVDRLLIGVNA